MTDTKSAEQLAGEVKAAFDAQQQAVKKDFISPRRGYV